MKNKHIEQYRHKYKIEKCAKTGDYKIIDPQSGVEMYPPCGQDAASLHAYWVGKGKPQVADDMLEDILMGKMPVSMMKRSIEEMVVRA